MTSPAILRYTAFTDSPEGGNPAGVVLDASALSDAEMQQIAADLAYSESAFVTPRDDGSFDLRYFSPAMEVPFCGHATIATAVALAERDGAGPLTFHTQAGVVPISTQGTNGNVTATLTSVVPHVEDVPQGPPRRGAASAPDGAPEELDPELPPRSRTPAPAT